MGAEKRAEERGEVREPFDEEEVASFRECTGLMPALPRDRAEDEALAVKTFSRHLSEQNIWYPKKLPNAVQRPREVHPRAVHPMSRHPSSLWVPNHDLPGT